MTTGGCVAAAGQAQGASLPAGPSVPRKVGSLAGRTGCPHFLSPFAMQRAPGIIPMPIAFAEVLAARVGIAVLLVSAAAVAAPQVAFRAGQLPSMKGICAPLWSKAFRSFRLCVLMKACFAADRRSPPGRPRSGTRTRLQKVRQRLSLHRILPAMWWRPHLYALIIRCLIEPCGSPHERACEHTQGPTPTHKYLFMSQHKGPGEHGPGAA